ncbi:BPSL0067 family protein [Massilia sp. TS11]|uniref:BPSL0067 family protein n=1 Tax=Massilia sp. TS11 TaxID=2908003 RepID=UPI001EDA3D92|nr:BPSL0067 family protein [Massilia sp. TS11]MCG2583518.1 BPSL0067 family protein [Massilia sp. TS11]
MAYVARNYLSNSNAPLAKWTCAPTSNKQPYDTLPPMDVRDGHDLCGQCVSFVKQVCPSLPPTHLWQKGVAVKGNNTLSAGTVIATFNEQGRFHGHAAIYVNQNPVGINIYDQYVNGQHPKPVGPRTVSWGGHGLANDGNNYYVVE